MANFLPIVLHSLFFCVAYFQFNLYVDFIIFVYLMQWVPPSLSVPILDLVDVVFQLQDGGWIRYMICITV